LKRRRCGEAVAVFAEGHEKARSKRWPGAGEGVKECVVGLSGRELGNLRLKPRDARRQYPQLRQQGFDQEAGGADDGFVGVQ